MTIVFKATVVAAGIGLAILFGGNAVAFAGSPSSTLTVQDGDSGHDGAGVDPAGFLPLLRAQDGTGGKDGAAIDKDGTQGSYKAAMDGSETGPLIVAAPQDKAPSSNG